MAIPAPVLSDDAFSEEIEKKEDESKLDSTTTRISASSSSSDAVRDISIERKLFYYSGFALAIFAFLGVAWNMMSMTGSGNDPGDFNAQRMIGVQLCMMGLLVISGVMINIGKKGLAGSGVILDPQAARDDLEPWSRMGGGMFNDAINEAKLGEQLTKAIAAAPGPDRTVVVKIRCPDCEELNDEDANFCNECGKPMKSKT